MEFFELAPIFLSRLTPFTPLHPPHTPYSLFPGPYSLFPIQKNRSSLG
ncbi:hypothetical protein [Moorena sp. SIO4G3]|nr:hypothetical protein [Moorena sp. SIO4G3]NEO78249.1 hypothetical protein [Moorena sp. SIO4G3]